MFAPILLSTSQIFRSYKKKKSLTVSTIYTEFIWLLLISADQKCVRVGLSDKHFHEMKRCRASPRCNFNHSDRFSVTQSNNINSSQLLPRHENAAFKRYVHLWNLPGLTVRRTHTHAYEIQTDEPELLEFKTSSASVAIRLQTPISESKSDRFTQTRSSQIRKANRTVLNRMPATRRTPSSFPRRKELSNIDETHDINTALFNPLRLKWFLTKLNVGKCFTEAAITVYFFPLRSTHLYIFSRVSFNWNFIHIV